MMYLNWFMKPLPASPKCIQPKYKMYLNDNIKGVRGGFLWSSTLTYDVFKHISLSGGSRHGIRFNLNTRCI